MAKNDETDPFLSLNGTPFAVPQSWAEKTFEADKIWAQVKRAMKITGVTSLPTTPRRPDVRLIIENTSGKEKTFFNPGNHSDKAERIPATGDNKAVMVMIQGDNPIDQVTHAYQLTKQFNLAERGLTDEFISFLGTERAKQYVDEAYGPAPYEDQTKKLVNVPWKPRQGRVFEIKPQFGKHASFGAREATNETAFLVGLRLFVRGTTTIPELMEQDGMVIVASENWETKKETTRPIVPSVAETFYGEYFDDMPSVVINTEGRVQTIDLADGNMILVNQLGNSALLVSKMDLVLHQAEDMTTTTPKP